MYRIRILDAAARELARLDKHIGRRVVERIHWLAANLDSIKPEALTGDLAGLYKLRVGDYRVVYEILHVILLLSLIVLVVVRCAPVPTTLTSKSPTATPRSPTPSDLERAREALTSYFSLLHAGRYSEAIQYYGGTYDILRDWNPDVDKDDYVTLFKRGCTANGLKCLRMRAIAREEEVGPTEFRFIVEFMYEGGTLFVRGPCCATETEMLPESQFAFTVKKVDNRFLVQELPVYVP